MERTERIMSKILEAFAEDNLSNNPATYRGDESRIYEMDRCIRGYKVGVLMMIEVFTGASDLFLDNEEKTA